MIRGQKRALPQNEIELNASIHNRFDVEVMDAVTGKIKQRAKAENIICNQLWSRLMMPSAYFNSIHYGTGSGTPAATDTSLFTFYSAITPAFADDEVGINPTTKIAYLKRKIQLSASTAVGQTITEVGIGHGTGQNMLVTHAMLTDMNGNQISIIKTGTDVVNIYATVYVDFSLQTSGITIIPYLTKGTETYPLRGFLGFLLGCYTAGNAAPPTTGQIAKNVGYTKSDIHPYITGGTITYDASLKKITCTMPRLQASAQNSGGFAHYIMYASASDVLYPAFDVFPTAQQYSQIVGEAIGTGDGSKTNFATAFPYPSSATIYVNGVAQSSGVTVAAEPLLYNDMGMYFDGLDLASTADNHIKKVNPTPYMQAAFASNSTFLYYNPNYSYGVDSLFLTYTKLYASNDLSTWETVNDNVSIFGTCTVPTALKNYKYWRFETLNTSSGFPIRAITCSQLSGTPVKFAAAPATGAVITADYTTPCWAKDADHVFDLSVTITLGEYTG